MQVSFRNRANNHRALLQKMSYKDKASYDATPTCTPLRPFICSQNIATHCNTLHHCASEQRAVTLEKVVLSYAHNTLQHSVQVSSRLCLLRSCIDLWSSVMGWLRSVGSIKLYVSFAEYCLFYRSLLQKRPVILSILLTKATPYLLYGVESQE